MVTTKGLVDFVEAEIHHSTLRNKLLLICQTNDGQGLQIAQNIDAPSGKLPKIEVYGLLEKHHKGGGNFPVYLVNVGKQGTILDGIRELRISEWMRMQYEKSLDAGAGKE